MVLPWVNTLLGLKSNRSRKARRLTGRTRKKGVQLLAEQLEARNLLTITATAITAARRHRASKRGVRASVGEDGAARQPFERRGE